MSENFFHLVEVFRKQFEAITCCISISLEVQSRWCTIVHSTLEQQGRFGINFLVGYWRPQCQLYCHIMQISHLVTRKWAFPTSKVAIWWLLGVGHFKFSTFIQTKYSSVISNMIFLKLSSINFGVSYLYFMKNTGNITSTQNIEFKMRKS